MKNIVPSGPLPPDFVHSVTSAVIKATGAQYVHLLHLHTYSVYPINAVE